MPKDPGQDGRLLLAIRTIKTSRITSIRQAAQSYDIPRTTLQKRLNGIKERLIIDRTKRKLTEIEEETLLQWILTMDKRSAPLRPTTVRNMADLLLADRDASKQPTVGINWVNKFVRRYDILKTRFLRKYDYRRALYKDLSKIQKWFELIRNIIKE